jgi:hypothetical protein
MARSLDRKLRLKTERRLIEILGLLVARRDGRVP